MMWPGLTLHMLFDRPCYLNLFQQSLSVWTDQLYIDIDILNYFPFSCLYICVCRKSGLCQPWPLHRVAVDQQQLMVLWSTNRLTGWAQPALGLLTWDTKVFFSEPYEPCQREAWGWALCSWNDCQLQSKLTEFHLTFLPTISTLVLYFSVFFFFF